MCQTWMRPVWSRTPRAKASSIEVICVASMRRLRHRGDLRRKHEALAVVAVGHRAAEDPERDRRHGAEKTVEAQLQRRVRDVVEHPADRRHLHPRADVADEETDPEEAEIAEAQRGERARGVRGV